MPACRWLKLGVLGLLGYPLLELLYRGRSHWSMALAGGLTLPLLARLAGKPRPLWRRCLSGAGLITLVELGFGLLVNRSWRVWDYRRCWANLAGHICPAASLRWFLLCLALLPRLERAATGWRGRW